MSQKISLRRLVVLAGILGLISLSIIACSPQAASADPGNTPQAVSNHDESETTTTGLRAVLSELEGSVMARQAEEEFASTEEGYVLYLDGQVQTGADGRARLDFPDETIVRIGPSSLFTLEDIEPDEDGSIKRLFLAFGQIWVVLMGGEMEVDTPAGVASVRGSYLSVWQDEDSGEIYLTCLEGLCGWEFDGNEVSITAGQTIQVLGFGSPPVIGIMSDEDIKFWLASNPEAYLVLDQVPGAIGGWVWLDDNGNGLQDEEETGLNGGEVILLSGEGEQLAAVEVNEDGYYLFEEVFVGEYSLVFRQPSGYVFTLQNQGEDDTLDSDPNQDGEIAVFELDAGEHNLTLDAGVVRPGHGAVCPLTGQPIDDEALLDLRPIFLSISIFPESVRPVTGINSAPVVFETLIDEGMTRLQALFYCGYPEALPENAGGSSGFDISGVRSGRVFYAELAQLFGAGLIFGGADPQVFQTIAPYTCSLANTADRSDIGAAGVDIDRLQGIADSCQSRLGNTDLSVWDFGAPPEGGQAVDKFLMHYNYMNQSRWIYDPEVGGYVRYQNTPSNPEEFVLATDRLTGDAVVRQNVLILKVSHQVMNSAGTIINFDLTNERGYAVLLRNGAAYNVCWSAVFNDYPERMNRYRPFLLYNCETKEPINLEYGGMWVNVVDYSVGFGWEGEYWRAYQPYLNYIP